MRLEGVTDEPQQLPRFFAELQKYEDECKVAKILVEARPAPTNMAGVTSGGDERRLRGLPCVGRGVSGAMHGTNPAQAAVANEMRVSKMGIRRRR